MGFFALGAFGFFAAPPLLKSLLVKQLSTQFHRTVSIDGIEINPFALTAKITGVAVKETGGKEAFGFDELFVNLSALSIAQAAPVIDEIRLQGMRIAVARLANGKYDISDLLDEWMKPSEPSPTPRFSINNIQLLGARLVFDDQPVGKVHTVSDINLRLPFLSSMAYKADVQVTPHFSAKFGDSPILLEGVSKPFTDSRESEISLDIDRFNLATLQAYLPASIPLVLAKGTVDSELKLVFKELSDQLFSLTMVGAVHLSELKVNETSGSPLIAWKKMDVEIENADLVNQRFQIKGIALDGLDANLEVNRSGLLNVIALSDKMAGSPNAGQTPEAKTAAKPLEWTLGEFRLTNGLLHWKDESNISLVQGEVRNINAQVGKIDGKLLEPIEIVEASYQIDLGERMRVERMVAKSVKVDLHGHRVEIGEVSNSGTRARLLRNKEGKIEWVSSPLLKTVRKAGQELSDQRPWVGSVGKLAINDLSLRIEDQATTPAAVQLIDGFNLTGENLSSEPNKKGTISLKTKVNQKGSLKVDGGVQIFPLLANLKVETQAIPVLPLQPYFGEQLNIALTRGQMSSKGDVTVEIGKQGFNAGYKGSVTLGDLLTVDKANNADFLKWRSLFLGGIDFHLQPMAVNVGEIALTDFYSRLVIDPNGKLNVASIVKKSKDEAKPVTDKVTPAPVAAAEKTPAIPIKIAKITLNNGTVDFSDFFVKPNYTVKVAKLGGRVTGLSSVANTVADMELRGTYANTAPVQILAKLNPLAAKSYLDLKADIKGVDMVGFSPYSGKYAGYNIEKGKLSLSVAYKLENNQLAAENHLFLDQFTFGDKVESPDATTLPVNLAISLLKNNRGEIDLNLPISGSLDDPQFSVGGLVVKVIVNLFVKAVSSPFALLGSMFGGGEELSNVEFAAGRASLNDAAGKKLEALAKALNERSALKLEITGRADPEADKEGIKRVAIERAAKGEKLKELLKKGGEGVSLERIEFAPGEYPVYLQRAYKEAKFPKPRNVVGLQKDLPVEEMEKLMLTNLPATPDDVRSLAVSRAESVQGWLIEQGKVSPERVFLLPAKTEADEKGKASRVDFSLR
ncbi:MAG: hypothetical protein RLZZ298_833 [Pseudomonadota bacterium]